MSPSPSPCPVRAYGASITSTRVAPAVTSSDWQSQEPRPAVQFRPIPTSPWDRRDLRNDFFIGRKRKASEMLVRTHDDPPIILQCLQSHMFPLSY